MSYSEQFLTTEDGWDLFYRVWVPDFLPLRAMLLIIHGIGEHGGRYLHVADYFVSRGYAVMVPDQRGYGRSAGKQGPVRRYQDLAQDVRAFSMEARRRMGTSPLILVGHSLGGLTILNSLLFDRGVPDGPIRGVILSSPALGGRVPFYRRWCVRAAGFLYPGTRVWFDAGSAYLSHDPAMMKAHQEDPLIRHVFTAGFLRGVILTTQKVCRQGRELPCPVLVLCAGEDRLVDLRATRRFFDRLKGDKEMACYNHAYHELFNEINRNEVFAKMEEWLSRLSDAAPENPHPQGDAEDIKDQEHR